MRLSQNRRRLLAAWLLLAAGCHPRPIVPPTVWPPITLTPDDRILILAPHPDDEVLGCAGIIQQAVALRLPLRIAFLTDGDNNEWSFLVYRKHFVVRRAALQRMGLVRADEAIAAARVLGVAPEQLTFLGYPDFGTLKMWKSHWGDRPPFQSMLTRVTAVPYHNALRPGAPYTGDDILRDLTTLIRDVKPTKIFVSHPGDHAPDHASLYLFTQVALWDLAGEVHPTVYPYLIHFKRWPLPRGFQPARPLEPPKLFRDQVAWRSLPLDAAAVERKRQALLAHATQYHSSARYLLSFIRPNELFGDFPAVRLRPAASAALVSRESAGSDDGAEELTDQERAVFVGLEERTVRLDGDALVLTITFSRPLAQAVQASVYVFGYRSDRRFEHMPKLHLQFSALTQRLFDQDRPLPSAGIRVSRKFRRFTIRIPLEALGRPQRILTSARTYLGEVPLDWTSWRVVELTGTALQGIIER